MYPSLGRTVAQMSPATRLMDIHTKKHCALDATGEWMIQQSMHEHHKFIHPQERHQAESLAAQRMNIALQREILKKMAEPDMQIMSQA